MTYASQCLMMKPQSPINRLLALLLLVLMLAFTACHDEPEEPILPQPDATFSGTLPVLYINTEGGLPIVSQDEYLHADWWIDNLGLEGYESMGSREEPLGMLIKGRGNWSWRHYYKKPYRIKLDEKQKLLGMKKSRHFILMAHADQDRNDFLTNTVGFELSRRIGLAYTPAQEPVEVVLNGQYIGLYFVTEKIRVDKNRVNIEEQAIGETDPYAITGGWLLEFDNHIEENQFFFREGNDDKIGVKYHSPDSLSMEQYSYLHQFILHLDDCIYQGDKNSTKWEKYIDMDTLACFYIVNEIMDNIESFRNSLFMHKHRGQDTKLLFGPVWDFGTSYMRAQNPATCFLYEKTERTYKAHWIEELKKYPRFQQCIRDHWNDFYPAGLNGLEAFIDRFVDKIEKAAEADAKCWPAAYQGLMLRDRINSTFKPMMQAKVKFLNEQWGEGAP